MVILKLSDGRTVNVYGTNAYDTTKTVRDEDWITVEAKRGDREPTYVRTSHVVSVQEYH